MNDYDSVYQLWLNTPGVGLRDLDDSREGIEKFVRRNPSTNFVAEEDGRVVGVVLSGHDGRRGSIYHLCVADSHRRRGIGRQLMDKVIEAMKKENITVLALVCFANNKVGNSFWRRLGWVKREDLINYRFYLNE